MNMDQIERQMPLYEHSHDFLLMHNLYESAVKQLTLKFEVLNSEFSVLYARNPIHHIESRVKSAASIAAKLRKKGLPLTIEAARESVNDIAGVRVVCSYIDDVYRVAEMLERQKDVEIIKRQDYIRTPNYNGYRSLHLDIRVPVYLSNRTEYVMAEIQIRTIAMVSSTTSAIRRTSPACPPGLTRRCSPAPTKSPKSISRCRTCTSASRPRNRITTERGWTMSNLFQSCQVSHRVRGTAAPRKRCNPFFAAACTPQKTLCAKRSVADWPTASQGMK